MNTIVASIVMFLSETLGENFSSYSEAVTEKIVFERTAQLKLGDIGSYHQLVCSNPAEAACLVRMLRVRYSVFFRDLLQFKFLSTALLPSMLKSCHSRPFRVWSAACAAGEEIYSLAILLDELLQHYEIRPNIQLFGSDIAEDALDEARQGVYPPERLGDVTLSRIRSYFSVQDHRYQIVDSIRQMVCFSKHDLLNQQTYVPPESIFGGFDLVLCRNFLMYLEAEAYTQVCDNLYRALKPGGILMLGCAEKVPEKYEDNFENIFEFGQFYRKRM